MGHGKETPRQKMIGMMYLVLTALLALNVSKDVLDAFTLIDDGLVKTTANFVEKNQTSYDIFDAELDKAPAKVAPYRDLAHEVKKRADQLAFDIQEKKVELIKLVDGQDAPALKKVDGDGKPTKEDNVLPWSIGYGPTAEIKQTLQITGINIKTKDNADKPSQMMSSTVEGKGYELQKKIEEFRDFILENVTDDNIKEAISDVLMTSDPPPPAGDSRWVINNFLHLPAVAVLTNMTKMQSDVRYTEAEVIQYLLQKIGATDTKVNKMEAVVLTKTNYVLVGNQFEARVLLAAYDSLQRPEVWLGPYRRTETDYEMVDGGTLLPYDERGRATIIRSGSSVGNFQIQGLLRMSTAEGLRSFPFSTEYQVGQSSTVISATAMNALYIGVDNPIAVQIAGVPSEQIRVSIDNGTIEKQGGQWVAKPRNPGPAKITATGMVDGREQRGSMDFRVRSLPTPAAKIANREGGNIERNVLQSQLGINASLGDDFLFNVRYTVTSFNMEITTAQGERSLSSNSAAFTNEQKALIGTLPRGTKVYFSNIKARGPDGNKDLTGITFTIQ